MLERAFAAALVAAPGVDEPALLPERLALASAAVLDVDGAGLSFALVPDRQVPVGSSDRASAVAERLQFSLGEGPCLRAHRSGKLVGASALALGTEWPVYGVELAARTPFRSAVGIPVGGALRAVATLQLYGVPPRDVTDVPTGDVEEVADLVGTALATDMAGVTGLLGLPDWLDGPPARARQQVWSAIGYLSGQRGCGSAESLALLRAHAFRADTDLETTAGLVLAGELPPA